MRGGSSEDKHVPYRRVERQPSTYKKNEACHRWFKKQKNESAPQYVLYVKSLNRELSRNGCDRYRSPPQTSLVFSLYKVTIYKELLRNYCRPSAWSPPPQKCGISLFSQCLVRPSTFSMLYKVTKRNTPAEYRSPGNKTGSLVSVLFALVHSLCCIRSLKETYPQSTGAPRKQNGVSTWDLHSA